MAGSRKKRNQELLPQHDPRAPLDSPAFLSAAQPVLSLLTADLLERADASTAVTAELRNTHAAERAAGRTAEPYEVWRRQRMVQVAAAWLLSCVFVRVLEDRGLLARHRLAGPGSEDSQRQFGELAPYLGPRDYLLTLFRELAKLPATAPLFDARHNLVWRLAPSQGGAQALLDLLRAPQPDAPAFRFGQPETRFLGDLYQDISADVRETYALLQTPDFVESFILDRTLEPALAEYGPNDTTLIDPTCGSGHFLLGAFARLLDAQRHHNPGHSAETHANNAMSRVFGVDINPYAVAIARFRLTLAFWDAIGLRRLAKVQSARPPLNVVVGDSLFHAAGDQIDFVEMPGQTSTAWYGPTFAFDDEEAAKAILGQRFAAVVGNPPYIAVKDSALRRAYADRFKSCAMNYALTVPFMELFFRIARPGGFTGQITSNSFTKREFGAKLIETVLPSLDLTLIINAAGAYIPGHGTPTVLVFGRNRKPSEEAKRVLAVLSKRGEPSTPDIPAKGEVWTSIVHHWHDVDYDDDYISVEQVDQEVLSRHPWSLEGGGAGQLKALLESRAKSTLDDVAEDIGLGLILGEDEVYIRPRAHRPSHSAQKVPLIIGEEIRDWGLGFSQEILRMVDPVTFEPVIRHAEEQLLWPFKTVLKTRVVSGSTTMQDAGRKWYDYRRLARDKYKSPLSITYAEVATHNHFVLERGGKFFKQTAPLIKLPADATEADHLALLAYLNSSTACFWMKQVAYPKGTTSGDISLEKGRPENNRYAFSSTAIAPAPIPENLQSLIGLAEKLESHQRYRDALVPASSLIAANVSEEQNLRARLREAAAADQYHLEAMVAVQEDLDWMVYRCFNLVDDTLSDRWSDEVTLRVEDRPFLAETPPFYLKENDRALWIRRREAVIARDDLRLIENMVHKRRWWGARGVFASKVATYEERCIDAARDFISEHIEDLWSSKVHILSRRDLTITLAARSTVERVLALVHEVVPEAEPVSEILIRESVPFLASARYSEPGLEKRNVWEKTWDLQRLEDVGKKVEKIHSPPPYDIKDFRNPNYFRLRGKLDVPKERFISYPGCESDADGEPVYGWAGWDHLQRASALMDLFYKRKNDEDWTAERLTPILAGLLELLPWLKQWHNEPDADGSRMGDDYEAVLDEELRGLGLSRDKLRAWRPAPGRGRGEGARAAAKASKSTETDDSSGAEPPTKRRGLSLPAAVDDVPTAEAPTKLRGRPPRAAAEAPAPAAPPMVSPAAPASAELALFPGEPPAQARKRGRPKKS